jgi:peptidoglycan/xylan/chitin deacetylase (PgdA/CDA1 family)
VSVLIVTYHAIAAPASPVCTPPEQLVSDLEGFVRAGFTFVSLDECAAWVGGTLELPARSVAVTFDDAYESVRSVALPVLARLKVPATVFAIAGRLGGDNQWPGQWASIPPMRLCDASGLRALWTDGVMIGSHSWTHPHLPAVPARELQREIVDSADQLAQIIGAPVRHFAYPYGAYGNREIEWVSARYAAGVTTHVRGVRRDDKAAEFPRIDAHDIRLAASLGISGTSAMTPYLRARRMLRGGRRLVERTWRTPSL